MSFNSLEYVQITGTREDNGLPALDGSHCSFRREIVLKTVVLLEVFVKEGECI